MYAIHFFICIFLKIQCAFSFEYINLTQTDDFSHGSINYCELIPSNSQQALDSSYHIIIPSIHQTKQYSNLIRPIQPVEMNESTNEVSFTEYMTNRTFTGVEGLYWTNNKCLLCPYYSIRRPSECENQPFRTCYEPLDGYCLDRQLSDKLQCTQNQFFYPSSWYGEFYYPPQRPFIFDGIPDLSGYEYEGLHYFFEYDMTIGKLFFPTIEYNMDFFKYGMTRRNIILHRNIFYALAGQNPHDDAIQPDFVKRLRSLYSIETHTWGLWLQSLCDGFCHRDALFLARKILVHQIQNRIDYFYLQSLANSTQVQPVCFKCPRHTDMVFMPKDDYIVPHIHWLMYLSRDCRPWFGAVPVLNDQITNFPQLQTEIKIANDGSYPATNSEGVLDKEDTITSFTSTLCPVNTYNRICDLTKAQQSRNSHVPQSTFVQPQCTPCPSGFHTDGLEGSWYCLPPLGRILVHRGLFRTYMGPNNISKVWARRDVIKHEFECGLLPSDCQQCNASDKGTTGFTPDQFNEKVIFEPLLLNVICPANSYCPHPFKEEPQACPPGLCSPMGSHSPLNCTCCAGQYFDTNNHTCVDCLPLSSSCGIGQYLKGAVECMTTIGPKSPQTCVNCTNIPFETAQALSSGVETGTPTTSISNFCPFRCNLGYALWHPVNQTSQNSCFRNYECRSVTTNLGPYQLLSGSFAYIANPIYSIPYDGVRYRDSYCVVDTNFTSFFNSWRNQPSLSGNVRTACSCGGVCQVIKNATLFNDYNCSQCDFVNPMNSQYTSQAIQGLTTRQNEHCKWTCNSGFYRDNQTCMNCTQKSLEICPSGYFLRGNGCAGDSSTVNTFNASNCFNCSQNLVEVKSNQYLDLSECLIKNCTLQNLQPNSFFVQKCGGGTNSVNEQRQCTTCLSMQYESRVCGLNQTLDRLCLSCTLSKEGYYLISNCTAFSDSVWYSCPANSYCPGNGDRIRCPKDTESMPLSTSPMHCYCAFGLEKNINTNLCERKICPDTNSNLDVPSITENLQSPYYLAWDVSSVSTICMPCSQTTPNVMAQGSMMNIDSCRCLSQDTYIPSFQANISCNGCATQIIDYTCTPTDFYMRPAFCMPFGTRTCECILPPNTRPLFSGCPLPTQFPNTLQCVENFVPTSSTLSLPTSFTKNITGSNLYVQSNNKWKKAFHVQDHIIGVMRSTFNDNVSHYSSANRQYILWMVPGRTMKKIFVQLVYYQDSYYSMDPCLASSACSPYETEGIRYWWQAICESIVNLQLVSFSVYPWLHNMPPGLFFGQTTSIVGSTHVVALLHDSSRYYASFVQMSVKTDSSVQFEYNNGASCGGSSSHIEMNIPSDAEIVDVVAIHRGPGDSMIDQSFYVGYNVRNTSQTMIVGLFRNTSVQIQHHLNFTFGNRQMIGVCMYSIALGVVNILVIFDDDITNVKSYQWRELQSFNVHDMEVELFLPASFRSSSKVHSFQIVFSRDSFIANYVLVIETETSFMKTSQIHTADQYQKTFTLIQDMPPQTSPKHVAVYETNLNQATMWASGHQGIYSIQLSKCRLASRESPPNYWDGISCKNHHCIRRPPCASEANKEYNVNLNRCVCKPGFFESSGSCILCNAGYYCMNGDRTQCSPIFLTSLPGSMYSQNCSCSVDGYYFSPNGCIACQKGYYCPDRWNRYVCPGTVQVDISDQGSVYPIGCVCAPGNEGAGCTPCPPGYICPVSLPQKIVQNIAVRLEIREKKMNTEIALVQNMVCETILPMIQSYFVQYSPNAFSYMKSLDTLRPRYFCIYHRSQDLLRHESYFIIMIQVDETFQNDIIRNLFQFYQRISDLNTVQTSGGVENYVTYLHTIPRPTQENQFPPASNKVSNMKIQCSNGEIPDATRVRCICRRGYENQLTSCTPCRIGTFKAIEGTGLCQTCPFQTTTTGLASSACISSSNSNDTNQGDSSMSSALNGDNLYIIIGGAVGGVVVAVVFVFVYYYCFAL